MKRLVLLFAVSASACDYGFKPASLIENMRLLAVKATPADLQPGEATRLEALIPDPTGGPTTILWLGCDPDPYNQNRSPCADADLLQNPGDLGGTTGTLPPGVKLIGFNGNVAYAAAANVFDVLPADDSRRITGTVGQVIAFAVAEAVSPAASPADLQALFTRVQNNETRAIIALYRVKISQSPERNKNPVISNLKVGDEVWPTGAHVLMHTGETLNVDLDAPDDTFEPYTTINADGTLAHTERVVVAWYSTMGRFTEGRTALRESVKTSLQAPGGTDPLDVVPEKRAGTMWVVLRDTRGGENWQQWPMFVCDESAEAVKLTSIEWPASVGESVVVHGEGLGSVLDVIVDGRALENGRFSPTMSTWQGTLPAGTELGTTRGEVWTKRCERLPMP